MKKILAISGKRGGYEAMLPLLDALNNSDKIEVMLLACDQHYMGKFGLTHDNITIPHSGVVPVTEADTARDRCLNLGHYVSEFGSWFTIKSPDLILLYGDRGEVAAAALSAATLGIPVAHLQAGDTTGCVDDIYRGMITETASLRFVSNTDAADTLRNRGYANERTFVCGDQHLDVIHSRIQMSKAAVCRKLDMPEKDCIGIILVHPDTVDPAGDTAMIDNTLDACLSYSQIQWFAIYPCSDPGHQVIIDIMHNRQVGVNNLSIYKNIEANTFYNLLNHADLIVGNSSSGIIEAPFLETPSLDIGRRQEGRHRGRSVHWASQFHYTQIERGIEQCIKYSSPYDQCYGEGRAYEFIAEKILDALFGHLTHLLPAR